MGKRSTPVKAASGNAERRPYQSHLRQAQAAETRERILAAGSALAHQATSWDWRDITVRTVAAKAGVSERTVYRHFATEQQLRDALMRRLEQEAGVSYETLDLDNLTEFAARMFESLPSFAATPRVSRDENFSTRDQRRRTFLMRSVSDSTSTWPEADRHKVAAILDVIWMPPVYERLVTAWGLDTAGATSAVAWAINVLITAIRDGVRPRPDSDLARRLRSDQIKKISRKDRKG